MMKLPFTPYLWMLAVVAIFVTGFGPEKINAAEETALSPDEDVQVLASGPIHEAFAEVVSFDPVTGIIAPKEPPALIEEIPPKQKPEGDVQWIPGYWAWDDERNEYIWVSGIWRVPPPGRQWVPGYWNHMSKGYQWISGYWENIKAADTEYLPEPPESVEVGPSSNAPSPNYIWIPGCWVWQYGRYAWRPGYWAVAHTDWVWVPDHYIWTPRGYIFVSGYWDYIVIRRGVLFAPVFFPRVHLGVKVSFIPGFVIDLRIFDESLFLRIRYCHYYYGNYYAPKYYRRGIYPFFSLHARRVVYDPIYAHQRWNHRNDHGWEKRLQTKFREHRQKESIGPPRRLDQRTGPYKAAGKSRSSHPDFVMPLDHAVKDKSRVYRFQPLSENERKDFIQREKKVRTYQKDRQGREAQRQKILEEKASKEIRPNKEKFSRSPITDRSNGKADRKKAPPARYITPKPNPNVEPLQKEDGLPRSWDKSLRSEDRGQRSMDKDQKSKNRGDWSGGRMQRSNGREQRRDDGRKR